MSRHAYANVVVCHLSAPRRCRRALAAYPPTKDEQSLSVGILGLATHRMYVPECRHPGRWALTPPFHPYHIPYGCSGHFLLHCPCRHRQLSVRKYDALCCPDFPLRRLCGGATNHASVMISNYILNTLSLSEVYFYVCSLSHPSA